MQLVYIANHDNIHSDDTEGHIAYGFELAGWQVIKIHEDNAYQALGITADLFLFHHWNSPARLSILEKINYPKAFWYFDKVWTDERRNLVAENLELVDHGFFTDGTFVQNSKNPKCHQLNQAIGDRLWEQGMGDPTKCPFYQKIAFTGELYSEERQSWAKQLKAHYNGDFCTINGVYNRDLFNLCAKMQIMLAPQYPIDDFYWGARPYLMMGSGGFLIHPFCKGLAQEFIEDQEIVFYRSMLDLFHKIDYYLDHEDERLKIQKAGFEKTGTVYNFSQRVKQLISYL